MATISASLVREAVDRLVDASDSRVPCTPVRDVIGSGDVALAYAVQAATIARREAGGARVVGHKIGLTSRAVQDQLGVHQPDFGILLDDMQVDDSALVPSERLLQPKIEAEIGFVLGEDLADGPELTPERIHGAVDYAVVALEIVDSRIAGWDITFADTVADNASAGLFVLGRQRLSLDEFEPRAVQMTMAYNGRVVSTGNGAACLDDPLNALVWLARTTRDLGDPLLAGQVILSGALGPMVDVSPGATVRAEISQQGRSLGAVTARFSEDSDS